LARPKLRETIVPEFSLTNVIAGLVFSGLGFVVFIYGKRMSYWVPMFCGIGLMMLPLFIADLPLVITSTVLGAIAIVFRNS
jgi:hypothetical protein